MRSSRMGTPKRVALDPVADLVRRLRINRSDLISACVRRWWRDHGFATHPAAVGSCVALALIEQRRRDAKLAGIMILGELLADRLRASDITAFERLFDGGHLADTELVDRFAERVLAPLIDHRTDAIARWSDAETCWQRRAACIALATRADARLADVILTVCRTVVWSHEHDDQTAVGALLRALSASEPLRVEAFVRRHARFMSRECARLAVAKLPSRAVLLAHHKRATSLR